MGSVSENHPLVRELRNKNGLTILIPSSDTWDRVRETYIADAPGKPLAIARPKNVDEVRVVVNAARTHKVKMSVRVGGHDPEGRSIADDCLVLDLREINYVEISKNQYRATIGGGVFMGDLIKTLGKHNLVTPFGYFPSIGYAGWAMMGGYGWLAPHYGLGVDQIVRAKVVTWKGDVIEADSDLLKGIRGAGGNFGVIVELGVKIYPHPKLLAGTMLVNTPDIKAATHQYFSGYNAMEKSPYGAVECFWFAEPQHLSCWLFALNFAWCSPSSEDGKEYLKRVVDLTPGADTSGIRETTASDLIDSIVAWVPTPTYGPKSTTAVSFAQMNGRAVNIMADFLSEQPIDRANVVLIHEMRGESAEVHCDSCFGARLPHGVVEIAGIAADPKNVEACTERFRRLYEAFRKTGDALDVTYASLARTEDTYVSKLFGDDYQFVMDLKHKYDPEGLFDNTEPRLRP